MIRLPENSINTVYASDHLLGKMISNMYPISINTEDGYFQSIEAYWHWLKTNPRDERREALRPMYGHEARDYGRKLCRGFTGRSKEAFKLKIAKAIKLKVEASKDLQRMLSVDKDLKLVHCFKYSDQTERYSWWLELWEAERKRF